MKWQLIFIGLMPAISCFSQAVRLEVTAGKAALSNDLVKVNAEEIGLSEGEDKTLVEITDGKTTPTPYEWVGSPKKTLVWKLEGETKLGAKRIFELREGRKKPENIDWTASEDQGLLKLSDPENDFLLGYQFAIKYPPKGIDSAFGRGGFIHPLNTLSGKTLTRIQPPDHYHHYGLWNPWTHLEYDGGEYDLWNIGDKKGTVRFGGFVQKWQGAAFSGFTARHEHFIFRQSDPKELKILDEAFTAGIFALNDKAYYVDITSELSPATDKNVLLKEYRYGGLGLRYAEEWTNKNSFVLTSTGKDRKASDGSLERWAITSIKNNGEEYGILFMSFPKNFNFPEPIRVWPTDANSGRGDMFFNFSPTKNKDWLLKAGEKYYLKYRLVVFDGAMSAERAEELWQAFAYPPLVKVIKN